MGMIAAKFFFEDQRYGWSETFYNASITSATLPSTLKMAQDIFNSRVAMLAAGARLARVVVSDDAIRRDRLVTAEGALAQTGLGGLVIIPIPSKLTLDLFPLLPDNPYSGVKLSMRTDDGLYYSTRSLTGVPDDLILDQRINRNFVGGGPWFAAFNNWVAKITSGWGFKVLDRNAPSANLVAATLDPVTGYVTVTTDTDLNLTCNDRVRIGGVCLAAGSHKFNGTWRTIPVSAVPPLAPSTKTFMLKNSAGPGTLKYLGGGKVQKLVYTVAKISAVTLLGPMGHKRGGVQPRERARPKKRPYASDVY